MTAPVYQSPELSIDERIDIAQGFGTAIAALTASDDPDDRDFANRLRALAAKFARPAARAKRTDDEIRRGLYGATAVVAEALESIKRGELAGQFALASGMAAVQVFQWLRRMRTRGAANVDVILDAVGHGDHIADDYAATVANLPASLRSTFFEPVETATP